MRLDDWFLLPAERDNPATTLDSRHPDGAAWSAGNEVRPLLHGATYFVELLAEIRRLRRGDLLLFTDWRGDPDERLDGPGTEVSRVLCEAAERGVIVKGLIWRSHLDRFQFSERENRHLGEEIEAAGGDCLLDMRVPAGGSHHQKFVVLRHPGRPELDIAYVGGIDLCHSRRDDAAHHGDPQPAPLNRAYGPRPPWHDVQAALRGPAVGDVETVFRERWFDPTPLARNPLRRLRDRLDSGPVHREPMPPQLPDPAPCGNHAVQLLRTYPYRRWGYPFAPQGERSVARGYRKAVRRARELIYFEDQYLWSEKVTATFAEALTAQPRLRLIGVVPRYPDQISRLAEAPYLVGRRRALDLLQRVGGDRVAIYNPENAEGTPIYVHAKVCIVDDRWATVGSDNVSMRSWTTDTELTCAVIDEGAEVGFARDLRLALAREHLGRDPAGATSPAAGPGAGPAGDGTADLADDPADDPADDLADPAKMFEVFASAADELDAWHAGGRRGPRPAGRLRRYPPPPRPSRWTSLWAAPLYRAVYDPDGRPRRLRHRDAF